MEFVKPPKVTEGFSKTQVDFSPDPFRTLTQLKKSLENYKNLCEQRILEIYPDHPLPVKEEHLGTAIPYLNELHLAKQKIAKLERQLEMAFEHEEQNESVELKYNRVIKDKLGLEESLRAEMLNSEEQRAYIEILKQALEENIEENRKKSESQVKETVKDQPKTSNLDSRRDMANLKNTVKDLESQIERSKSWAKSKESELKILFSENQQLIQQLKQLQESLQTAQEDNLKLEEEKSSLLDYIDEHSQKEEEMEKDMNELAKLFEEMKENYSETVKKLEDEKVSNTQASEELKIVHEELDKANKMIREMQKSNSGLKDKLVENQNLVKMVKEEKQGLEIKCENLISGNAGLIETLKEVQTEVEKGLGEIGKLKSCLNDKEENILKFRSEIVGKNQEINSLKSANHTLEMEKIMKNDEKNGVIKELGLEKQRTQALTTKSCELESKIRNLDHELVQKVENEQILKAELSKLSQYKSDFDRLKVEYIELQHKEKTQSSIINELRAENNERIQETETLFQESQKILLEKEELHRDLQDFDKVVMENKFLQQLLQEEKHTMEYFKEVLNNDKALIENKMKLMQSSEFKSNELIDFLQKQLQDEEKLTTGLKRELGEALFKLENQEIAVLSTQNRLFACVQVIFDMIPINYSPFSSTFSQAFKETLLHLHNNPSPDINDICLFCEQAADHIKFLFEINFDLHDEINKKNYEISIKSSKIESLSTDLENQTKNFSQLSQQVQSLSSENSNLKSDLQSLSKENSNLKNNLNKSFSSLHDTKLNSVYVENNLKNLINENKSLRTEKNELENFLTTKKRFNQGDNVYHLLDVLERERVDLQCQLMKCDSNTNGITFARELRQQLIDCEKQILEYRRSISDESRANTPLRFRSSLLGYTGNRLLNETPPRRERPIFK